MKTLLPLLALSLALAPAIALAQHDHASHAAAADHAAHDAHAAHAAHGGHDAHAAPVVIPADHVPWTPDAPLQEGMARVRRAMAALAHHDMGHMDDNGVLAQAAAVDGAIEYMFANCSLEPEPDIALHGLLARLMAGTQALREHPGDAAPLAGMRAALDDYARLFDDPGADAAR